MHRRARAIVAAGLALICVVARCATAGEWDGVAFEQASPAKMRCWLVLPTRLVPDDADIPFAEKPQLYSLRAGRNEYESVQLVILSANRFEGLSPKFTEFKSNAGGKAFSPSHWQANKLGQVPGKVAGRAPPPIKSWPARPADAQPQQISPAMISSSAAAAIPDPLLPEKSFDVDVGLTRIWLTVHVPADAAPGDYLGTLRLVTADGVTLLEVPLGLRVWNYTLPETSSLIVMADVQRDLARPHPTSAGSMPAATNASTWERLRPYYDQLKTHRINATGEIDPPRLWTRDQPPPDFTEYEAALKYVLDDLGFVRFRFPAGGPWNDQAVFKSPPAVAAADGIWIDAGAHDAQSRAMLAKFGQSPGRAGEFNFENEITDPLWLWLQIETHGQDGQRSVELDGTKVGKVSVSRFLADGVGLALLPKPLTIPRGKHTLHIEAENTAGSTETLEAIYLTPQQDPDFDKILRNRAVLSDDFKQSMKLHISETGQWLRQHGWLKKAQINVEDQLRDNDYGRIAVLEDWIAELLPTVRRESRDAPSFGLRKMTEVWMPDLSGPQFDPDEWAKVLQPGQELWATHARLMLLGNPPLAMRLLPWLMARHEFSGLSLGVINNPRNPLLYSDANTGVPIGSVRFDNFRDGMEDYETLGMLRTAIDEATGRNEKDPAKLKAIERSQKLFEETIPSIIRSARDFSWDPTALQAARDQAGELLSILSSQ